MQNELEELLFSLFVSKSAHLDWDFSTSKTICTCLVGGNAWMKNKNKVVLYYY